MSARQLNRLAKAKGLDPLLGGSLNVGSDESDAPDDSEDEGGQFASGVIVSASAFGEDSDESSSNSEEEDGSDNDSDDDALVGSPTSGDDVDAPKEDAAQSRISTQVASTSPTLALPAGKNNHGIATNAAAAPVVAAAAADQQGDDDEYLDSIISELALKAAAEEAAGGGPSAEAPQTGVSSPLALLLRCDRRCLKLDQELRRKFGGGDRENGAAGGGGGRGRAGRRGAGAEKQTGYDGGTGREQQRVEAHRGAEWFVFERSSSLEQLQRKFETVQSMHDPNLLASFASRAPYHADALLQLGMVFAHTGQMDRASEFVGRSLYVLESATTESFRPVDGACRLDATVDVNKTYFAAMFRHMQMSGMVGGARTALEVGRLLLSLDPLGDPMGCLLALDSHALASRQGQFLLDLHGSELPIGCSPSRLKTAFGSAPDGADDRQVSVTVQDLPGLSMSKNLAMLDTKGDAVAAREAMASTLLRFPVMLEPLLEKCGISPRSTTYPHNWKSVMEHPHFGQAKSRLPPGHVLFHLASIFAQRGGEIWKHERAEELLYDGAGIALQGLAPRSAGDGAEVGAVAALGSAGAAQAPADARLPSPPGSGFHPSASEVEVLRRAYCKESPIHKYLDLALSDFDEAFALLPQDANILDPRLMGPNFMNERVRWRLPDGAGAGGGRGMDWGGGQDVLDEVLAMAMQVIGRQDAAARLRRQRGGRGGAAEGNLNPESPLAQLFWQTLLPWNVFPTPSRPPPPPPQWL
eukprot:g6603.t1